MAADPQITLVVPVYEERDNIIPFLVETVSTIDIPHKALIIYDHDRDTTLHRAAEAHATHANIEFIKNRYGTGVINAFKTGFAAADTPYIAPIMADLSDTPETVNAMYDKIRAGYDLVVASRYADGGAKIGGPRLKKMLSMAANRSLKILSGIPTHDMTNAFILYRKEVLEAIEISSTGGFEITMEIIAKAHVKGFQITEVPTVNRDRTAGDSKFQLTQWMLKYLYWYFYILFWSGCKRLKLVRNT